MKCFVNLIFAALISVGFIGCQNEDAKSSNDDGSKKNESTKKDGSAKNNQKSDEDKQKDEGKKDDSQGSAKTQKADDTSTQEFVIDVRSKTEWDTGHLENATLIPHTEIEKRIEEVTKDKSAKIVLY